MFFICCNFKLTKNGPTILGWAVCSDSDTPVTFLHEDGSPAIEINIWSYDLIHSLPWARLDHPL